MAWAHPRFLRDNPVDNHSASSSNATCTPTTAIEIARFAKLQLDTVTDNNPEPQQEVPLWNGLMSLVQGNQDFNASILIFCKSLAPLLSKSSQPSITEYFPAVEEVSRIDISRLYSLDPCVIYTCLLLFVNNRISLAQLKSYYPDFNKRIFTALQLQQWLVNKIADTCFDKPHFIPLLIFLLNNDKFSDQVFQNQALLRLIKANPPPLPSRELMINGLCLRAFEMEPSGEDPGFYCYQLAKLLDAGPLKPIMDLHFQYCTTVKALPSIMGHDKRAHELRRAHLYRAALNCPLISKADVIRLLNLMKKHQLTREMQLEKLIHDFKLSVLDEMDYDDVAIFKILYHHYRKKEKSPEEATTYAIYFLFHESFKVLSRCEELKDEDIVKLQRVISLVTHMHQDAFKNENLQTLLNKVKNLIQGKLKGERAKSAFHLAIENFDTNRDYLVLLRGLGTALQAEQLHRAENYFAFSSGASSSSNSFSDTPTDKRHTPDDVRPTSAAKRARR